MIYAVTNFSGNVKNAKKYSDTASTNDLVADGIIYTTIKNKEDVVRLLNDNGIKASIGDSEKTLVKKCIDNIDKPTIYKSLSKITNKNKSFLNANGVNPDCYECKKEESKQLKDLAIQKINALNGGSTNFLSGLLIIGIVGFLTYQYFKK